ARGGTGAGRLGTAAPIDSVTGNTGSLPGSQPETVWEQFDASRLLCAAPRRLAPLPGPAVQPRVWLAKRLLACSGRVSPRPPAAPPGRPDPPPGARPSAPPGCGCPPPACAGPRSRGP